MHRTQAVRNRAVKKYLVTFLRQSANGLVFYIYFFTEKEALHLSMHVKVRELTCQSQFSPSTGQHGDWFQVISLVQAPSPTMPPHWVFLFFFFKPLSDLCVGSYT